MQGKCNYHSWNRLFLFSFPEGRIQILPLFASAIALNSIHDPGWCSRNCCKWHRLGDAEDDCLIAKSSQSQPAHRVLWEDLSRSRWYDLGWFPVEEIMFIILGDSLLKRDCGVSRNTVWKHWYTLLLLTNNFLLSSIYSHLSTFLLPVLSRGSELYVVLS